MRPAPVEGIERLLRWYNTPSGKRMFRYTMVSVVSTIVSLGVLGIVFGVVHLWSEVPSAIFANAVATVPSYYLNRQWAWGKTGRSHLMKEVVPFWLASFAGLALSTAAAAGAHSFSRSHNLHHFGSTVVVLGANLAAYGLLWIGKFLLFNKLFHHNQAASGADFDEGPGTAEVTGTPGTAPVAGTVSVSEVRELEGDTEVPLLERLDNGL